MSRETAVSKKEEAVSVEESISLKIPSRAEFVLLARLMVSQVGEFADFEHQDVYDLKLAITEAATNVIRHADVDSFEIEYRVSPGAVEITVKDTGDGFEEEDFTGERSSEGGFGLAVIRSVLDEVALESSAGGGTLLRMVRRASATSNVETG
ncbi:hypothetical protein BH23ACT11_BH23ACT11_09560 [soil metagenome]